MKWPLYLLLLVALGCTQEAPMVRAQSSKGCALTAWMMQQPPHSIRTQEAPPPVLRDTVVTVNGTAHPISIPAGFTMTVFANGIPQCRGLALSPDGVLYATSFNGKVYALPDHNRDGVADSTIVVFSGLGDPDCVGFYHDTLYVSNDSELYRLTTASSSRIASGKTQIASFPHSGSHFTRNFVFDTVRNKIYVEIGSNGNMDTTDFAHRARIVEMNPDGSGYRSFASGLRNPEGMDFDPRTGALWANCNGMDDLFGSGTQLTDNNPSEGIYLVCDGANYGWPYCYGFQMRNPQSPWRTLDTNIVKTFSGPVAEVLAHSAPLSLHFYRGTKFPAMYHNAIFQCYHGSWDRSPPAPPRITVLFVDTDGRNARVTDFVNGFEVLGPNNDSNTSHYFGRPVQLVEGADSALYVSDDAEGVIFRIAYTGTQSAVQPITAGPRFDLGIRPNPATGAIEVAFFLPGIAWVQADLFDILGKKVKALIDKECPAGMTTISIDTDSLTTGTYVLRAEAGGMAISRRIKIER